MNERTIASQFRARDATYTGKLRDAADLYRAAITEDGTTRGLVDTIVHGIFGLPLTFQGRPDMCSALLEADGTPSEYAAMVPENEAASVFTDGIILGVGLGQLLEPRTPRLIGQNHVPRMRWWDPRFLWQEPYSRQWHLDTRDGTIDITPGDGEWCMFTPYPETDAWRHGLWMFITLGFIFSRDVTFDEVRHSEVLAPVRVGRAEKATSPAARLKFEQDMQRMARDAQFVLPEGWVYEIVESKGTILNVYADIRKWAREQTEIGLTGNTVMVSAGAGSGMVNLSVFERVTASKRRRYAGAWCDFVREQVLTWWGEDNYRTRNVPKPIYDTESPEDSKARAQKIGTWGDELGKAAKGLKALGLRMEPASVVEQLQRAGIRTEAIPGIGPQLFDLDPKDAIGGIRIDEWRADQGLDPVGDGRGDMMMSAAVKAGGPSAPVGATSVAAPAPAPGATSAPPVSASSPPVAARPVDGELDPEDDGDEEARSALAAGLAGSRACEHGRTHVCERCGVRRAYGAPVPGADGQPTFPITWQTIKRTKVPPAVVSPAGASTER